MGRTAAASSVALASGVRPASSCPHEVRRGCPMYRRPRKRPRSIRAKACSFSAAPSPAAGSRAGSARRREARPGSGPARQCDSKTGVRPRPQAVSRLMENPRGQAMSAVERIGFHRAGLSSLDRPFRRVDLERAWASSSQVALIRPP
jgi:hypothetical protein